MNGRMRIKISDFGNFIFSENFKNNLNVSRNQYIIIFLLLMTYLKFND